jgi:hypothetical protein
MKRKDQTEATDAQILLEIHLHELGFSFQPEFKFHPDRAWRFDYMITCPSPDGISPNFALEIEGGIFTQGRHLRAGGYLKDMEKYREAAMLGWKVFRFSPQEILNGTCHQFLQRIQSETKR